MSDAPLHPDDDAIPLELDANPQPVPVPVPPPVPAASPAVGPQPVPVPAPANGTGPQPVPVPPQPKPLPVDDTPIAIEEGQGEAPVRRRAFGAGGSHTGFEVKKEFQRPLNVNGTGATRCRLFHSKISDGPLTHMESMINEWLDEEEIEVKHVGHVIGTMEGKRAEPNMVVLVWY